MKMKKLLIIILTLGLAGMLSSCVKERRNCPNDGQVQFNSSIQEIGTRISGDNGNIWDGNEQIGIYMVNHGGILVVDNAANIPYRALSTGNQSVFTAVNNAIYYPTDASRKVNFFAYHPYSATVSNFEYLIDVGDQSNLTAIDLMLSDIVDNGGLGYDENVTTPVNLQFVHMLSKLVINVVAGNGVTDLTGLTVTINGMNTRNVFGLNDRTFNVPDTPAPVTPNTVTPNARYEAILLPVNNLNTTHFVEFRLNNETYTWNMSNDIVNLTSGNMYTYEITLNRTGVGTQGNITSWTNNNGTSTAQ